MTHLQDASFMDLALKEARKAYKISEVPVGAVIVKDRKIISQAHNTKEKQQQACSHAEVLAIQKASRKLQAWRLDFCTLYVSLEPCLMCLGACLQARISNLFYACSDKRAGAFTYYNIMQNSKWNHKINIHAGLKSQESSLLLKQFFKQLRHKNQAL